MFHRDRAALQSIDFDTDASVSVQLDDHYDEGLGLSKAGLWSAKGPSSHAVRASLGKSAALHADWALAGLRDANRWQRVFAMVRSYLLASTWSTSIAEAAFLAQNIQPRAAPPVDHPWVEHVVRFALVLNYSVACFAVQSLPWVGPLLAFVFMCFVDGYFCFEQVWVVRGWSLEKRLRFAESHWSFLLGFGVPSTAISFFHPSGLLNLMLFMLVFPICTVLAYLADPQPHSSAFGAQTSMLPSTVQGGREQLLAWLLPARIPLFWPTVQLRRWLVRRWAPPLPPKPTPAPSRPVSQAPLSPLAPRRSAASFVGGAWSPAPGPHTSAVHIPMADSLGTRKSHKIS
ncbi:unnamed protein product [Malassezia sympodialis ATCC 42132]|uniref:uncharacterized protein n=1 Tax=Malassezia sympodialis (strain ATCC 42132) TaxID=1230383 RepID=UPI0002C1FB69|nr:uncharacterized protein MSY001_1780 [Malassezia sympodialis ATCC 42132]CCU99074.1 unnamed protein product [Malassezia sympodialis ATCC 42132]|eukprot:XP_018740342.1 uncharacterized protein MSY001_1780 [Malassezia sympodialis ATCC 42132]